MCACRPQTLCVLYRDGQANGENIDLFGMIGQEDLSGAAGTAGAVGIAGGGWKGEREALRAEAQQPLPAEAGTPARGD